jgi:putative transcriptional regulator
MPIVVTLDVMLARRKMTLTELKEKCGMTMANLSILKTGKARALRFSTLNKLCEILECQPAELFEHVTTQEYNKLYRINRFDSILLRKHLAKQQEKKARKKNIAGPRPLLPSPFGRRVGDEREERRL